jgi:cytoskeletal protein RodZ
MANRKKLKIGRIVVGLICIVSIIISVLCFAKMKKLESQLAKIEATQSKSDKSTDSKSINQFQNELSEIKKRVSEIEKSVDKLEQNENSKYPSITWWQVIVLVIGCLVVYTFVMYRVLRKKLFPENEPQQSKRTQVQTEENQEKKKQEKIEVQPSKKTQTSYEPKQRGYSNYSQRSNDNNQQQQSTVRDTRPQQAATTVPVETYTVQFKVLGENGGQISAVVKNGVNSTPIHNGAKVVRGSSIVFTANPDTGYEIKELKCNGYVVVQGLQGNEFHGTLNGDVNVTVEFEQVVTYFRTCRPDSSTGTVRLAEELPNKFDADFEVLIKEKLYKYIGPPRNLDRLETFCEFDTVPESYDKIETLTPGALKQEGGNWLIDKLAKIKFL